MINKICEVCKKVFDKPVNVSEKIFIKRKYCSFQCFSIGIKGHPTSNITKEKISNSIKRIHIERQRRQRDSATKMKIRLGMLGKHNSPETEFTSDKISGQNHPRWKGGKTRYNGYDMIHCPSHPNSRNGYIPEHHLTIEKIIGRFLKQGEVVHHINGNKLDNRTENLMYFSNESEHQKFHNSY
jgi:hypothetical protein